MTDGTKELAALGRLVRIAQSDTGQSRRVANFLLSWWNAQSCGGFDMTDLWSVDRAIADDMLVVFRMIMTFRIYPTALGHQDDFAAIVERWRPETKGPRE
ncbi:DUF7673 family protein [Caenispirillum salinarum]|nr:hypothetical protein [Caenispirillum salinarum]